MLTQDNIGTVVEKSRASIDPRELYALLETLADYEIKRIVEIGVHRGYSLEVWRRAFNPEMLIGIEPNRGEIDLSAVMKTGATVLPFKSEDELAYRGIQRHLSQYPESPYIDMLFIDGDHTRDHVEFDYNMYSVFVKPQSGVIVFHDISGDKPGFEGISGVKEFWDEVKIGYRYREITSDTGTGIGVLFTGETP